MSQEVQVPSDGERKAFLEKLGQFRGTLSPSEQRMLDTMAMAAHQPTQQGEVQGYGWQATYAPVTVATPQIYVNAFGQAFVGTAWQQTYVQTGVQWNPFLP
jgi:hypothetical protein